MNSTGDTYHPQLRTQFLFPSDFHLERKQGAWRWHWGDKAVKLCYITIHMWFWHTKNLFLDRTLWGVTTGSIKMAVAQPTEGDCTELALACSKSARRPSRLTRIYAEPVGLRLQWFLAKGGHANQLWRQILWQKHFWNLIGSTPFHEAEVNGFDPHISPGSIFPEQKSEWK